MNRTDKFYLLAVFALFLPLVLFCGIFSVFWLFLPPPQQMQLTDTLRGGLRFYLVGTGALMLGLGAGLVWVLQRYVFPVARIAEEAELIRTGNPAHRIQPAGSRTLVKLSGIINAWAEQIESEQADIEARITEARSESETQKNILAAFMAELPEGVVICNAAGKILLYNKHAKLFLAANRNNRRGDGDRQQRSYQIVGLGRWIHDLIDPHMIQHAVAEMKSRLADKELDMAAYFVLNRDPQTLRVEAAPILDHLNAFAGFVLILYDITTDLKVEGRTRFLWQTLTRQVRSAVTGIRSAIETTLDYPDMSTAQKTRLFHLIHEQALTLGHVLDETSDAYAGCCAGTRWPLVFIKDLDLIDLIIQKAAGIAGFQLTCDTDESCGWVRVDTYSMTLAAVFILARLHRFSGQSRLSLSLKKSGRFIVLDMVWAGDPVKIEQMKIWEDQSIRVGEEHLPFTLKEILGHHHMDIGAYSGKTDGSRPHIRIFMPAHTASEPLRQRSAAILPESRPEFFDFDLFHQLGQDDRIDSRRLDDLTYTVFDMETTGLDINGGDRIVSIGAVRIVNARLLPDEPFDQLVNPGRAVPAASTKFHGITDDMVAGQPSIEEVLPRFYDFADETVLVAHNAAFDMRLLQINERYTGLKFVNPVLDTLLLSAVVHPSLSGHGLEDIARRMGVKVQGRHTAMGDTIATANIFLKLIPLLFEMGIYTLKDAREASQKTYLARLKY